MKTIGILGGLGPQATIDLEQRLHHVAQQLIPQPANTAYPPLISWFFREPPVLLPADSPRQPSCRPSTRGFRRQHGPSAATWTSW